MVLVGRFRLQCVCIVSVLTCVYGVWVYVCVIHAVHMFVLVVVSVCMCVCIVSVLTCVYGVWV